MKLRQASTLMNRPGLHTLCKDDVLQERKSPYENYYKLTRCNNTWQYGLFVVENQNNPFFKEMQKFHSEAEGAKYFLFHRLSSYYFSERIRPFMISHSELDIGGPFFDLKKLKKAMSLIGIPPSIVSVGKVKELRLERKRIALIKKDDGTFIVSFMNGNGEVIQSTMPVDYKRALFIIFKKVYLLHLFEREVSEWLEKENLRKYVSDRDISIFLS
ncbi:hypothetical protein [Pseudalkalibacillus sp. NRS-1564]|uniref:hypothetical protein n=1 Tax=Pseudalkalibacillus sp. NRS-1564 TaxID=3233900 RepID=UPI003D2B83CB